MVELFVDDYGNITVCTSLSTRVVDPDPFLFYFTSPLFPRVRIRIHVRVLRHQRLIVIRFKGQIAFFFRVGSESGFFKVVSGSGQFPTGSVTLSLT